MNCSYRNVIRLPRELHALERDVVEDGGGLGLPYDLVPLPKRDPSRDLDLERSVVPVVGVDGHADVLAAARHVHQQVGKAALGRQGVHVGGEGLSPAAARGQLARQVGQVLALLADPGVLVDAGDLAAEDPVPVVEVDGVDGDVPVLGVVVDADEDVGVVGDAVAPEHELALEAVRPEAVAVELERLGEEGGLVAAGLGAEIIGGKVINGNLKWILVCMLWMNPPPFKVNPLDKCASGLPFLIFCH